MSIEWSIERAVKEYQKSIKRVSKEYRKSIEKVSKEYGMIIIVDGSILQPSSINWAALVG
jgi:histone H3/H4